ncbi:MAG: leucyl aminopeptidase [Gemmatimonadaceae bacterium]
MPFSIDVQRADLAALETPLLVLLVPGEATLPTLTLSDQDFTGQVGGLNTRLGGVVSRVAGRRDFRGLRDEAYHLVGEDGGVERILLLGTGNEADRASALRRGGAVAARAATRMGVGRMAVFAGTLSEAEAEALALGLIAGAWKYDDLKSPPPEAERRAPLDGATILATGTAVAERGVRNGVAVGEGHSLARRLGMMPGNLCTPDFLEQTAREIAQRHGMTVTVLNRADMEREGMGSFLCVAQGTPQEPKLIALEYRKGAADQAPVTLVGKGLCFDSGGISIKPAQGMEWMKFDMCGAAGVLGAMEAIGRLGLQTNVVGLIGATTNMPSGTAVKPGDVVRASNGKYIEIINTDAEGRLVLADVLAYAKRFNPAAVVDAATLTGACVIALGHTATGVMGNDQGLVDEVLAAGRTAGEPGWQLPMWDDYKELIKSDVGDIKNSGGRAAGTITAALFLQEFAEGYPWVHLDVAGTAYSESNLPTVPAGPTGVPVGTFVELVRARAR